MNIITYYNENGMTFEEIIKDFLLAYYNLENITFLEKYDCGR